MADSLNFFLMENADKPIREKEVVVSNRFKGEDGKAIPFVIRLLSNADLNDAQRKSSVTVKGKMSVDAALYKDLIVCKALVNPPLKNAKLQDSYGAMGELDLLNKMLVGSEVNKLFKHIANFNELDESFDDRVDEAKN